MLIAKPQNRAIRSDLRSLSTICGDRCAACAAHALPHGARPAALGLFSRWGWGPRDIIRLRRITIYKPNQAIRFNAQSLTIHKTEAQDDNEDPTYALKFTTDSGRLLNSS